MTNPIQPSKCIKCGKPVLPDPETPGVWVDQENGRHCREDPRQPHEGGSPAVADVEKKSNLKLILIIGGAITVLISLVAVIAITLAMVFLSPDGFFSSDNKPQAKNPPAPDTVEPGKDSTDQSAPGAIVPCNPDMPHGFQCFPPDEVTGEQFLERIAQSTQWNCFKLGEEGNTTGSVGSCEGSDEKSLGVSYDTDTHDEHGTMNEVSLHASASTTEDLDQTLEEVINIALPNLWPDNKEWQQEAADLLTQVKGECFKEGAHPIDPVIAPMSLGYEITCTAPILLNIGAEDGSTFTSVSQTLRIEAPLFPKNR